MEDVIYKVSTFVKIGQLALILQAKKSDNSKIHEKAEQLENQLCTRDIEQLFFKYCPNLFPAIAEYKFDGKNNAIPEMVSFLSEHLVDILNYSASELKNLTQDKNTLYWNSVWSGYFYTMHFIEKYLNENEKIIFNENVLGDVIKSSMIDKSLLECIENDSRYNTLDDSAIHDYWHLILNNIFEFDTKRIEEDDEKISFINNALTEDMNNETGENIPDTFFMNNDTTNKIDLQKDNMDCCAVWMSPQDIQVCIPGYTSNDILVNVINEKDTGYIIRISIKYQSVFVKRSKMDIYIQDPNIYDWKSVSMSKGILIIPVK